MNKKNNENQYNMPNRPMPSTQGTQRPQYGEPVGRPLRNPVGAPNSQPPPPGARRPGSRSGYRVSNTRPLEPYPGYTPEYREPSTKKKRSMVLPVLFSLIVLAAITALVYFFFLKGNRNTVTPEMVKYYEQTNAFRSATVNAEGAVVALHNSLQDLPMSFVDSDAVEFIEEPTQTQAYVDNEINNDYFEQQHPATMGRIIIPSIGTNGPLCADSTEQTLYYGFGIVPFMKDMSEEGLNVILGHRVLTKDAGMLYMDEMEPGDPFYIDDYRIGKRYVYETIINENVTYDEYLNRFVADGSEPYEGQLSMLVTCDPFVYGSSERRILVYGRVVDTIDIPSDDPYYLRYKGE